jgi:hypothetical protein
VESDVRVLRKTGFFGLPVQILIDGVEIPCDQSGSLHSLVELALGSGSLGLIHAETTPNVFLSKDAIVGWDFLDPAIISRLGKYRGIGTS